MPGRNIVLIQPALGDMDAFRDRPTPPLGLLSVAAGVPKDFEVRLVDQRTEQDWRTRLRSAIDARTVLAGVTAMTGAPIKHALDAVEVVRSVRDVPVVWGGVHASLLPRETAADAAVDYVVEGEGDIVLGLLAEALAAGRRPDLPGVWYRDGRGITGRPREGLLDPDSFPLPAYHLVDMERYFGSYAGERTLFYQSSRGCPFRCTYCYNSAFNRSRWRPRAADRVLADIEALRRQHRFSAIYFLDDDFFVDRSRAFAVLAGLKALGLRSSFQGVDLRSVARWTDDEILRLEDSGVQRVSLGVEAGTTRMRRDILHKWGDLDEVRRQIRRLAGRRFRVLCTFMVGLPSETAEDIRQTIQLALWVLDAGPNFRIPQLYNWIPYPGTPLYRVAVDAGFKPPATLREWAEFGFDTVAWNHGAGDAEALQRIVFLSKFLDRKVDDYGMGSRVLRAGYLAYRLVARARLRRGILRPLPERHLFDVVRRLAE